MTWRRYCRGAAATVQAGEEFAALLCPGDMVLLSGPLGAGKTTFVQGVARGLGVTERVTSPTFTMVREHACHNDVGVATLLHADLYRIESVDEAIDLALGELVEESAIALVEWGELAAPVFGRDVLTVGFTVGEDDRWLEVDGAVAAQRSDQLEEWAR
ncbi:MAG TPA: tRNA (adenosine(37)-N6)-threonylcarbamoyltransferase complex ATPase subunit type 1 TsaE [Acidimicrobiales bacterium]|nr:tRNA (adenosine(37)-N6)-threonylcarbamoyltransferase complex ATPase subunit type 1 TsaE [Acidimicrobiales bacterium]